jgi:hypothetical protein
MTSSSSTPAAPVEERRPGFRGYKDINRIAIQKAPPSC